MKRRVTIVEVARACNLATSTVSNALADKANVLPSTKKFVIETAARLGYRASTTARSLRMQRSWTISLLTSDIANSYYAEILVAIEIEAWRRGYSLLLANTQFSDQKQTDYIAAMLDKQIDGVILASHTLSLDDAEILRQHELPVVFLSRFDPKLDADRVGVDNLTGGRLATDHLIAHGHERIGFVAGRQITSAAHERYQAYRDALSAAGLPFVTELVAQGNYTTASGTEAAHHLLGLPNPPTALFCANDLMAIGAMAAAHARGLRVPDDLSIVGFDDIEIAAHPMIGLSTVHVPRRELGRITAALLLDRIEKRSESYQDIRLAPHLISRRTVAAPAKAETARLKGARRRPASRPG